MPFAPRDLVLVLMLSGVGFGLIGALMTGIWRKDDISRAMPFRAGSDSAAHPERYVKPQRVFLVRCINLTAAGLFLAGALLTVWIALRGL